MHMHCACAHMHAHACTSMCAHADALADEGVSGQREGGEEAVPSICIRRHEDHMHRRQASIGVSIGHEAVTGAGARPGPLPLASGASLLPWGVPVPSYAADCDSLLDLYST